MFQKSAHGGLGTYFSFLSTYRSQTFEHRFLIPDCHYRMIDKNLECYLFNHTGRNFATIIRMIRQFLFKASKKNIDIIVFHSFFSIAALLVARLFYPSVPRIYIPHGWTTLQFRRASFGSLVADFCERIACRAASCCISVSSAELSFARSAGFPGTHRLIANAVDARAAARMPESDPRESNVVNLLYVGRLDYQKGVDLLLKAYAEAAFVNPALRLKIIGESARTTRDSKLRFDARGALNIEFLGWLPRAELDSHYAQADALIVPSRWEAFGLVVREAARHGTPAIVSDRGALPDLVKDRVDGVVFHLSEDEDIGPLTELLSGLSGKELHGMRNSVWAKMEVQRSAADMVAELEKVIDSLLRRNPSTWPRR